MARSSSDGLVADRRSAATEPPAASRPAAASPSALTAPAPTPRPATPLRWRVILDAPGSGPENMARDHALARCLGRGEAVLRLYGWTTPTVSFGRNEPAARRYDRSHPAAEGAAFVRRPTGGRAVLHDREVTYAVVVPQRAFGGARDAYVAINRGLVAGLRTLGVPAAVATDGSVEALDAGPCFLGPAPGEVTAGGRKLVGSAQARIEGALLQHGSVILGGDQGRLDRMTGRAEPGPGPAAVSDWAPMSAQPNAVAAALLAGCRLAWGGAWAEGGYTPDEDIEARRLVDERYATHDWTWRR